MPDHARHKGEYGRTSQFPAAFRLPEFSSRWLYFLHPNQPKVTSLMTIKKFNSMLGNRRAGFLLPFLSVLIVCQTATAQSGLPAYPLKPSANHRYLIDQNNVPFLVMGDSPQPLIANLSEADADFYFSTRKAQGFNAAWINLLCVQYTHCRADGSTFDGIFPFTTSGDLSTPNEAYFARADAMIRLAAKYGIVVFLDPIETGGWLTTLRSNGTTKANNYGLYLGNRYKSFPNIIWLNGNDFQTWTNSADDAVVQAVARGLQTADPNHVQTVELDFYVSGSLNDPTWAPIIQLSAAYTYFPTYAEVLKEYNRSNFIPTFMIEANYEFEQNFTDFGSPQTLRRQEYWTMLSGATGQLYGSLYTDKFPSDWKTNLNTPGAIQIGYLLALFSPRPWYNLIPDQSHTVVTAGFGTFSSTDTITNNSYVTAASTPDGTLGMAYLPTIRAITVAMNKLSGPANARWFDPSNGSFTPISGSPFANTGTRQFSPPGNNSDGNGDWVLLLEVGSASLATLSPGTLTFASQSAHTSSQGQIVTLTNGGTTALTISSITLGGANPGDFSQTNMCGGSLAAGANCLITVTFTPTSGGSRTALLSIADNANPSPQTVSLTGTGMDFSLSASSGSATVNAGQSANFTLAVSPDGGFNQLISFTCTGAPAASKCTVTPASVTPNGTTAASVSVSITTTARGFAIPKFRIVPPTAALRMLLALSCLAVFFVLIARRRRRLAFGLVSVLLLLLLLVLSSGCANTGSYSPPPAPGTPAGTSAILLTGNSGSISHSTTFTLKVN